MTLWREDYDVPGVDAINKAFEALTGATIQVTKVPPPGDDSILPKWAGGEKPDILYLEGFAATMAKLNASQTLQPMDNFAFVQNIQPSLKTFGVYNGVRYWAPLTNPTVNSLLYNKTVMQQLGLKMPTNEQELLSFCDQARAKGTIPVVIGEKDNFMAWATLNAMTSDFLVANPDFQSQLLTKAASFTDPEFVKRIQAIVDMKAHGCFETSAEAVDYNSAMKLLMTDKGAIFNCGNFCVSDFTAAYGVDAVNSKLGFLPISYSKPAAWIYGGDLWGIYLPKTGDATREAAARAYVDFALGPGYEDYLKVQGEDTRYPVYPVPDSTKIATPLVEAKQALESGLPGAPALEVLVPCSYGVPGDVFTELSSLFVGQMTALQVAQAMQNEFQQSCHNLSLPGF